LRVPPYCASALFDNSQPLLARLVRGFIRTLFALFGQPIFVSLFFVKLALCLPRLTSTAPLLFHAINNPMALLVCKIFFNPVVSESLAPVITVALFTPFVQVVFSGSFAAKLAPVFPLLASTAPFQFCFDLCHGRSYIDIGKNCQ